MVRSNKKAHTKKQKGITAILMRGIVMILLLTILIPVIVYNTLPDWAFFLVPATRLWFATESIINAYNTEEFDSTLRDIEKSYDSTIELYTADGRFIYSTNGFVDKLPNNLNDAKTVPSKYKLSYQTIDGEISAGKRGFLLKTYDSANIEVTFLDMYSYLPGNERVEICMQVSQISTTAKIDFIVSFCGIMSAVGIALIIITVFIRRFTRQLQQMCVTTDKMSKLDFSEKCPPTKLVELTTLSDSINQLSDSLDNALNDLQEKNAKLLKDIENERTIDNLRKIFISGISHELKTPIAIIQGYAEGAKMFYQSGNTEAADRYCDTIMEEATRMNNMIMKLLEITKYDSGAYEPIRENFDLHELIQDWFNRNQNLLAEKNITVHNMIPDNLIGNGDPAILESVVNNYISNAVSHVSGERIIEASAVEKDGKYRVYIFNTGANIADKDIDKIWTSFYRADKSLSRSQGRFGLGLAIVASIQKLHGEKYGVENTENGVKFWFDIKKGETADET